MISLKGIMDFFLYLQRSLAIPKYRRTVEIIPKIFWKFLLIVCREKMKNSYKYFLLILIFGVFKLQAMDQDESTLLIIAERAELQERLKAYEARLRYNSKFENPKYESLLVHTIGLELRNGDYRNLDELLKKLTTEKSPKVGETMEAIDIIKNQRDYLLKECKNSKLKLILENTDSPDQSLAIIAYYELIHYTLPVEIKTTKQNRCSIL